MCYPSSFLHNIMLAIFSQVLLDLIKIIENGETFDENITHELIEILKKILNIIEGGGHENSKEKER